VVYVNALCFHQVLTLLIGQQEGHLTVKTAAAAGNHAVFAYGSCCA